MVSGNRTTLRRSARSNVVRDAVSVLSAKWCAENVGRDVEVYGYNCMQS